MVNKLKNISKSYRLFYKWDIENNFFIVSTGRTATNFFAHFFDENFPEVLALHEPAPDLFHVGMNKYRKKKSVLGVKGSLKIGRYKEYKKLKKDKKNHYIESNPNLSLLLPEINRFFPNPKILFVTRDLPSYLLSAFNKSPDGSNEMFFYGENDHRQRLTPFDVNDKPYQQEWAGMSREERIAWYWKTCNAIICDNLSTMDHLHIKYEDIFLGENRVEELQKVIQFFNLPNNKSEDFYEKALGHKKNTNPEQILKDLDQLDQKKKDRILAMTSEMRRKLEYI